MDRRFSDVFSGQRKLPSLLLVVFPKMCFVEKGKALFFVAFNIIIIQVVPEKFTEIPKVVQKIVTKN